MLEIHFGLVQYTISEAAFSWFSLTMMSSNWSAKLAQLAQIPCIRAVVSQDEFSLDLVLPYSVGNARSAFPFCCGVPGGANSNLIL
jgi:hypothetical protein